MISRRRSRTAPLLFGLAAVLALGPTSALADTPEPVVPAADASGPVPPAAVPPAAVPPLADTSEPVPPPSAVDAPPAEADTSESVDPLVPGVVGAGRAEYPMDTPDQVLPPLQSQGDVPVPEPEADVDELVEYLPRSVIGAACTATTGTHQRQVERLLKLTVDGVQSAADCRAVKAFQVREKIKPANGYAGPVTWARAELLAARKNLDPGRRCPVKKYAVACVDLDRQLMWVRKDKKVTFPVVNIRSGRVGYATRTGWHAVYWRHKDHWSSIYNTPMPFSQFFSGGQAFHAVYGQIATPTGSRGCVNLSYANARKLWDVLRKGDRVYIWGKRPGR
ncbi:L,D-transpeptidase family protein [Streptomyces gardneri]|uniref:L,D-transpeptidase family protein n=1 Tax=Streptomyces gardneri TaxID=66892 RepID=UPI001E5C74BF|nr:L,D-transpeptidase [Streptomyces gardneri]